MTAIQSPITHEVRWSDIDTERAVVGSLLLGYQAPKALDVLLAADVTDETFHSPALATIFAAARRLIEAGEESDPLTVGAALEAAGLLEFAGGRAGLVALSAEGAALSSLRSYSANLRGLARRRQVHAFSGELQRLAESDIDPTDLQAAADRLALLGLAGSHEAHIVTLADVAPTPIRWLWEGRIPLGAITILDGDPGLGKSILTVDLATRVSTGTPFPGEPLRAGVPAGVVLLSAEDSIEHTIAGRAAVAGADTTRVHVLDSFPDVEGIARPPSLPGDVPRLTRIVERCGASLVIVDPLMAFLGDQVKTKDDHSVRRAMFALKLMAERTGAAVVIVRHLNKTSGGPAIYRGGGSIGILGASRAGFVFAADPDDPESRRVLAATKANLAPLPPSLACRLVKDGPWARIVWEGSTHHQANDLLSYMPQKDDADDVSALDSAMDFLREVLGDGPLWAKVVKDEAAAAGHSWATVKRASNRLRVKSRKYGKPGDSEQGWKWHLPEGAHEEGEDAHS